MPTIYKIRELSPDECEVQGAIAALAACYMLVTFDSIQAFTGLPKTRVSGALKRLKSEPPVQFKTVKGVKADDSN